MAKIVMPIIHELEIDLAAVERDIANLKTAIRVLRTKQADMAPGETHEG